MILLRSAVFNLVFFGGTTLFALALLPTLLMPRRVLEAGGRLWARWVTAMLATIVGLRVEVRGLDDLPEGAVVIAAKHQSALDTIVLPMLLDDAACALKRELTLIPVYGWYLLKARQIVVDRSGRAGALRRLVRRAGAALAAGRPVVVFPEGTRVTPGARRTYLPGVAAIYTRLAVPVVPVAVNTGLFWGRRRFAKRPGVAVFAFLPPILPGMDREAFQRTLEDRIEGATAALVAEARRSPAD